MQHLKQIYIYISVQMRIHGYIHTQIFYSTKRKHEKQPRWRKLTVLLRVKLQLQTVFSSEENKKEKTSAINVDMMDIILWITWMLNIQCDVNQ